MWFEAWSAADPLGTKLGDLTEAFDKEIQVVHNGEGYLKFKIRQDSSQSGWCTPGTHIRVRWAADDDPYLDFSAFLEEGQDAIISTDEEGGEVYHRGGRGSIVYPESRAVMYPTETIAGPAVVDAEGTWVYTDIPYGAILNDVISQAKARSPDPLADLTDGISGTVDGNGDPWPAFDGEFEVGAGMGVYAVEKALQSQGLIIRMQNPLTIKAYATYGQDLSGTIHFQKGVNIRESAERQIVARPIRSRVLVQGSDGAFLEVTDGQTATLEGVGHPVGRREGYTMYRHSSSAAVLTRAGQQFLRKSRVMRNGPTTIGVLWDEFVPWVDYEEGDTVAVTIPGVWSGYDAQIEAITVNEDDAGDNLVSLSFEQIPYDPASEMQAAINEMIHGPGCKPGCGHGGDGGGEEEADATVGACSLSTSEQLYATAVVNGQYGPWGVNPEPQAGARHPTQISDACGPGNDTFVGEEYYHAGIRYDKDGSCGDAVYGLFEYEWQVDTGIGEPDNHPVNGPFAVIAYGYEPAGAPPDLEECLAGGVQIGVFEGSQNAGTGGGAESGSEQFKVPIALLKIGTGSVVFVIKPLYRISQGGDCDEGRVTPNGGYHKAQSASNLTVYQITSAGWITAPLVEEQDGIVQTFALPNGYSEVSDVWLNGVNIPDSDYDASDGTSITFIGWAPAPTDLVEVRWNAL